MNRLFILLAIITAVQGIGAQDTDPSNWWTDVTESHSCTAKAEEGNAVVRVELEKPDEERVKEIKDAEGVVTGYSIDGKKLPERFWPGCAVIKKFELEWEGKKIEIPERFWTDLAGFRIQSSPLKLDELPAEKRFEGEQFLASLNKPRVYISADGGTILIEWDRPEECDGRSTIRWIISKSGAVMRHRHTPPHEC